MGRTGYGRVGYGNSRSYGRIGGTALIKDSRDCSLGEETFPFTFKYHLVGQAGVKQSHSPL